MKAKVDQETCIGCGLCAEICPSVFEMNNDSKASVKVENVPENAQKDCREAAQNCPVEAISIEE
jgi:ferredoxin